ncbi:MAG: GH116 family glycosyl hydrolase [Planctomycetota bacterium]
MSVSAPIPAARPASATSAAPSAGPRTYRGRALDEIAFPLGGLGAGSIALGGWGQLRDFELFHTPNKGLLFNYTFFTLHMQREGDAPVTRVLQGPVGAWGKTNTQAGLHQHGMGGGGHGVTRMDGAGLPHFRNCVFVGEFPFARLHLDDPCAPLTAELEAFNPFLPLNADDSGLPCALFHVTLRNPGDQPVRAVLFANLENKLGFPEAGRGEIAFFEQPGVRGLAFSNRRHKPDSVRHGTLALYTPHADLQVQTHWFRGAWFDPLTRFWDEAFTGRLAENRAPAVNENEQTTDVGCLGLNATVPAHGSVTLPVWIVWHTPWIDWKRGGNDKPGPIKTHYATRFADASAVAGYLGRDIGRLSAETRAFAAALHGSTLPAPVLDAVSSQISILKTTTCLRLTDGTFYGWEGCHDTAGCCEGTCTHVWNYAQALPFLFPALERTIREADYKINLHDDGSMTFRIPLPLGTIPQPKFHPAADGQMGGILKLYRDWQLGAGDDWLKKLWPRAKQALEYAWKFWDADRDGVMEGIQHNTFDIEFYGPNSMMGSFYLGALRAGEEIARHLGDTATADTYRHLFESGRAKMDASLFNGEYYIQDVRPDAKGSHDPAISMGGQTADPKNTAFPKYQYGAGCLSDQLIGQWFARLVGLGDLFDPAHVKSTLSAIFRYNFRSNLSAHPNPQRIYAHGNEAGLLICSWPRGGRPALPFPYADEVWPGNEYQVASHLIFEGLLDEGLAIVAGTRARFDGERRNPWDEIECGHHYARSMASYALLPALTGFQYSAPEQRLGFAPQVAHDNFAAFFSVDAGWGVLRQHLQPGAQRAAIELHTGRLILRTLDLAFPLAPAGPVVHLAGRSIPAQAHPRPNNCTRVVLTPSVTLEAGQTLTIDSWN